MDSTILTEGAKFTDTRLNPAVSYAYHAVSIDEKRRDFPVTLWHEKNLAPGQKMEQVWFSGVHSNVGGWYENRDLSSIALVWMMEKAKAAGMKIDLTKLSTIKAQRNPVGKIHESYEKFWKFRGQKGRKIPPKSHVHHSVIERRDGVASYNPKLPPSHVVV